MLNRRKAMGVLGGALATLLARDALQSKEKMNLVQSFGQLNPAPAQEQTPAHLSLQDIARKYLTTDSMKAAFRSKLFREDHRYIYGLDEDIASKKSWSQAAKIAFQRQRIVDQREKIAFEGEGNAFQWLIGFTKL